jgi:hypothetical protein
MIFFSKKQFYTGGRGRIPVWRVSATTPEDFERLREAVSGLPRKLWSGQWPTEKRPWNYLDKRQPCLHVKREVLDLLLEEGAVELPQTYCDLLTHQLRKEFWELWWRHGRLDGQAAVYWKKKLIWLHNHVYRSGEFVVQPDWYESDVKCDVSILIPGLKLINQRIENFDLGQRRRVNQENIPDKPTEEDIPENIREYYNLPEADRASWLASHPWLTKLVEAYQAEMDRL